MKMSNPIFFIILSLAAGMMIPFQSAMNAALGKSLQSPYFSTLTVFLVAAAGISLFMLVSRQPVPAMQQFSSAGWWSYLGGVLGGAYILLIVLCAPRLGIGNVTVLVLLGQVISAVCIDHFGLLHTQVHPINWQRLAGVLLIVAGVYFVKKY
jgi:transporter family-2 protein